MGDIAFSTACQNGDLYNARRLLKTVNIEEYFGTLQLSAAYGHFDIVVMILTDKRLKHSNMINWLFRCICSSFSVPNCHELVEILLNIENVKPTELDNYALQVAINSNKFAVADILFKHPLINPNNNTSIKIIHGEIINFDDCLVIVKNGYFGPFTTSKDNLSLEQAKEKYLRLRWQYRIGGEKWAQARNSFL